MSLSHFGLLLYSVWHAHIQVIVDEEYLLSELACHVFQLLAHSSITLITSLQFSLL